MLADEKLFSLRAIAEYTKQEVLGTHMLIQPQTVLAMLDEIEELRLKVSQWRRAAERLADTGGSHSSEIPCRQRCLLDGSPFCLSSGAAHCCKRDRLAWALQTEISEEGEK